MKNITLFSSATRLLFCAICLALLSPTTTFAQSAEQYLEQAEEAQSNKERFYLYMKAAELGNAEAQCRIGDCYRVGHGVDKDYNKALIWYKKSADQGYAEAMFMVGYAYSYGQGVQEDDKMAERYLLSAAYKGYSRAYFSLGVLYEFDLENKNEAIYWYKKYVDYTYAEKGEPNPDALEGLRELGVYYHPGDNSASSNPQ